jgi:hypothetical protein
MIDLQEPSNDLGEKWWMSTKYNKIVTQMGNSIGTPSYPLCRGISKFGASNKVDFCL